MMGAIATVGVAKLLDFAFTAWLAGIERDAIVTKVREMEEKGATPDEMTDAIQVMRTQSEKDAQAKIDKLP